MRSLDREAKDHLRVSNQGARGDGGALAQFMARQVELLQPRRLILGHHDDWLPGFSIPTDVGPIRAALADAAPEVELFELGYLDGTAVLPV